MNDRSNREGAALYAVGEERSPLLEAFGARLRLLRARSGFTRKSLASSAGISERYLASLEFGRCNPSLIVLDQLGRALQISIAEMTGDVTTSSPDWLMIRELLAGKDESALRRARLAVGEVVGTGGARRPQCRRVALIGLRGAGKSTLGRLLAEDLDMPFIELSREIERLAGSGIHSIHDLYGPSAYRRYERRAIEEVVQIYPEAVIATPGGLVSDPATFNVLLRHCVTIWLQADPTDHMSRVALQGDMRPMENNAEAMKDLRQILEGRSAFYAKAELSLDTSRQSLDRTFDILRSLVRTQLALAG